MGDIITEWASDPWNCRDDETVTQGKPSVSATVILSGWPKSSFGFICKLAWKHLSRLFGQPGANLPSLGLPANSIHLFQSDTINGTPGAGPESDFKFQLIYVTIN